MAVPAKSNRHKNDMKTARRLGKWFVGSLALTVLTLFNTPTFAGQTAVTVNGFSFDPSDVTVNVNDDVVWTWASSFHNTVSDDALWDSGVQNAGYVFTNTFTSAGSFPYRCTIHQFTGNVTVQGGASPPTVDITSPTNGASFTAPAIVPITATAGDADGSVTNVSFFDGTTFLGQTNNTPYTVTGTFGVGSHPLTAIATDNDGLSKTSNVVNISVSTANQPPSVTITNPVDGSTLSSSAALTIRATANDPDGSVTNVQFFDGGVLLGSDATSPYTFNTTLAPAVHTLTAVAFDNLGLSATSAPVQVTMARYLPPLTNGNISIFLVLVATNLSAPLYGASPPGDTN